MLSSTLHQINEIKNATMGTMEKDGTIGSFNRKNGQLDFGALGNSLRKGEAPAALESLDAL